MKSKIALRTTYKESLWQILPGVVLGLDGSGTTLCFSI